MINSRTRYYAKSAIHGLLARTISLCNKRALQRTSLTIFTYHSFCREDSRKIVRALPVSLFEQQVKLLRQSFHLVSLSEGLRRIGCNESGAPMASITIDDGFSDNFSLAWPVLKRHDVPATIFPATDFIENQRIPWPTRLSDIVDVIVRRPEGQFDSSDSARHQLYEKLSHGLREVPSCHRYSEMQGLLTADELQQLPERTAMTWEQLRAMSRAGIEIGSHTVFHGLLPFLDSSEVERELADSKRLIEEQLQVECAYVAYPNGDHDSRIREMSQWLGYKAGLTQDFGSNPNGINAFSLRRVEVPYHDPIASFRYRAVKARTYIY